MDTEAFENQFAQHSGTQSRETEAVGKSASRRDILRGLSVGAVAAMGAAVMSGCDSSNKNNTQPGGNNSNNGATRGINRDVDILNFALNLEYLEAEFYTYAVTGQGIETQGVPITGGNGTGTTVAAGKTVGGVKVDFSSNATLGAVIAQLADDERKHVVDLQNLIAQVGGKAVARPNINLAALAPKGVDISTVAGFLVASRAFEDTGVSAYGGAARFINNADVLRYAARILAVESYHAANIRLQTVQLNVPTTAVDALDVPPTLSTYFAVEPTNALSIIRTPRQVLNIVLAAVTGNETTGGFFPGGVNANLATLTSLAN